MSMHDALRAIGIQLPWMVRDNLPPPEALPPPSPADDVMALVRLANGGGRIEPESATWIAVQKWAASEIISGQAVLETATGDRAAGVRVRIAVMRELLALHSMSVRDVQPVIEDSAPYAP
jgi:hypothetical protein